MSKWLTEWYDYNSGEYFGLAQVGEPHPVTSDCNRSLDKVVSTDGIIRRKRVYIIPNDAILLEGNAND